MGEFCLNKAHTPLLTSLLEEAETMGKHTSFQLTLKNQTEQKKKEKPRFPAQKDMVARQTLKTIAAV